MNISTRKGISFGLTSGIITTLGMLVGLFSGTKSRIVVIGGILTIAIADAFSDSLGIHISEEAEGKHSTKEVWEATLSTFFSKLFFALTFIVPVLIFELAMAVIVSIVYGLFVLALISYIMAKEQKSNPLKVMGEHLLIAVIVVVITFYVGEFISTIFI